MNDELEYWKAKFNFLQEQLQNDVRYLVALKVSYYESFVPEVLVDVDAFSKDELAEIHPWGKLTWHPKPEMSYVQHLDALIGAITKEYDKPFMEAISRIRACEQQMLGEKNVN